MNDVTHLFLQDDGIINNIIFKSAFSFITQHKRCVFHLISSVLLRSQSVLCAIQAFQFRDQLSHISTNQVFFNMTQEEASGLLMTVVQRLCSNYHSVTVSAAFNKLHKIESNVL